MSSMSRDIAQNKPSRKRVNLNDEVSKQDLSILKSYSSKGILTPVTQISNNPSQAILLPSSVVDSLNGNTSSLNLTLMKLKQSRKDRNQNSIISHYSGHKLSSSKKSHNNSSVNINLDQRSNAQSHLESVNQLSNDSQANFITRSSSNLNSQYYTASKMIINSRNHHKLSYNSQPGQNSLDDQQQPFISHKQQLKGKALGEINENTKSGAESADAMSSRNSKDRRTPLDLSKNAKSLFRKSNLEDNSQKDQVAFKSMSSQAVQLAKLHKQNEKEYHTKTIEIDIQKLIQSNTNQRRSVLNRAHKTQQQSRESSGERRSSSSLIGPSFVNRRDKYDDNLNSLVDQNIEELAKLVAIKQKLQSDIFDKSKNFQDLMGDISHQKRVQSQLITQQAFAEQHQRHLSFQVMQLEASCKMLDEKQNEVFENIRKDLIDINEKKIELKQKVNEDTKFTSQQLKSIERQRILSSERVQSIEREKEIKEINLFELQNLISRGQTVEKSRLSKLKQKQDILQSLISTESSKILDKDPKCYLRQRVSTIMVDISKGIISHKRISKLQNKTLGSISESGEVIRRSVSQNGMLSTSQLLNRNNVIN